MKPIQIKSNKIEIPFQDADENVVMTLWFDKGDEPLKRLEKEFEKIQKIEKTYKGNEYETIDAALEKGKESIKRVADSLFGEGSFDKLYELNPSIYVVTDYIYQIAIGIKEELEAETIKDVEKQYLK